MSGGRYSKGIAATRRMILVAASAALTGCAVPDYEETFPMAFDDNVQVNTIASTLCTRGTTPFKLTVAPDGSAVARIIDPNPPKGAPPAQPIEFPASLIASDRRTVVLAFDAAQIADEPISEALSPVLTNRRVVLRGDSFDCAEVFVRESA